MEISSKDIRGFKVFAVEAAEPCGTVADICVDIKGGRIAALVIETISIIPLKKTIAFDKIEGIGKNAVWLKPEAESSSDKKIPEGSYKTLGSINSIVKLANGKARLRDISFNMETGLICDIIVSKTPVSKKNALPINKISFKDNTIYADIKGGS